MCSQPARGILSESETSLSFLVRPYHKKKKVKKEKEGKDGEKEGKKRKEEREKGEREK